MIESDYWAALEFRICREFAAMPENHLRFSWCDGFLPERYELEGPLPRIRGRVWICDGPNKVEWEFTLFLEHPVGSPSEIDWSRLLPPEDVTQWLAIDLAEKRIEIEPSAAIADGASPRGRAQRFQRQHPSSHANEAVTLRRTSAFRAVRVLAGPIRAQSQSTLE